jgi:hypothetical protein
MSNFKRNPKAEEEFPFLKDIGDLIEAMNSVNLALKTPQPAATEQKKAQDEGVRSEPGTAGFRHLSSRVH